MELKVGDEYKCPEGHSAKIVWIREDKKIIAVKCSSKHLNKVVKKKEIYQDNVVFLIRFTANSK